MNRTGTFLHVLCGLSVAAPGSTPLLRGVQIENITQ